MSEFETLVGLVSQYSPSGQEREAAEWLVTRMQSLGYDEAFVDNAGNAVGVMGHGPKQIMLLGHIDTVPGEIAVRRDDIPSHEKLYGRGTVDAKGPLACFVDAVSQVGARDGWQFIVIGAVEEERDSEGARFIVDQYKPDFLIVGEPNQWDRVALGYKGSAWVNITVKRAQAHTASGEQTAAEIAVEVWLKIKSYTDTFNKAKQKVFDKLLVTLRGLESESNDFEQWARLKVGVRLPVDVSPADWYAKLNEITGDGHACVEPIGYSVPAWECAKNTQIVRAFLSGIRSLGGEPRFVYKTGTADLNIVAPAWKCPALVYGPGDSALDHTPHEHIDLQEYARAVRVLTHVLLTIRT
jgi:LysW-gamma-L-lysine carboxypeptidase